MTTPKPFLQNTKSMQLLALATFLVAAAPASATLTFSHVYGDSMVLQRAPVRMIDVPSPPFSL